MFLKDISSYLNSSNVELANPYHDREGKFTSRQHAVAVVGKNGVVGYLSERDSAIINAGLAFRSIDNDYKRLNIGNNITVYADTDTFYKATGLKRVSGWNDFAAVGANGDIHLSPSMLPGAIERVYGSKGLRYISDIVGHEVLHSRPRVAIDNDRFVFASRSSQTDPSTAWREEGLTQALTMIQSSNPPVVTSYNPNVHAVMAVSRAIAGNNPERMAYVLDRLHKYNTKTLGVYISKYLANDLRAKYGYTCSRSAIESALRVMGHRGKNIWDAPDIRRSDLSMYYQGGVQRNMDAALVDDLIRMRKATDGLRRLSDVITDNVGADMWRVHEKSEERLWKERGTIFIGD